MPFWSRYPKGTYTRPSAEWYAHQRGRCSLNGGSLSDAGTVAYGLFNNSSPGVCLHLLGLWVKGEGEGVPPLYGRFVMGAPDTTNVSDPCTISATSPIYSNDPMPPGIGVFGEDATALFNDAFIFDPDQLQGSPFYHLNEIAVITPGYTFELYLGSGLFQFFLMFEWYWARD